MSDPRLLDGVSSSRGRRATTFLRGGIRYAALGLALAGCASAGTFTWYRDVPRQEWAAPVGEYVIAVGDTVNVRVYDQENLSTRGKVRVDGRLALPMLGEVAVAGKAPRVLAAEVEGRLKEFIVSPRVIVNVEETRPTSVTFVGEVARPGSLTIEPGTTLLQALAQAGGPAEFADDSRIFVLRQLPAFRRIRFTYDALVHNEAGAATFVLLGGDVVVVE
jgi:polysaccharide export outer membrane protein